MSASTDDPEAAGFLPSPAMTTPPMTTATTSASPRTVLAGRLCVAGGLLGAGQSAVLLLVPPAVGPDRVGYPLTAGGHVVLQLTFVVQHLLLLAGVLALLRVAGPVSRSVRAALGTTAVGLGLLTLVQLYVITLADATTADPRAALNGLLYGVSTILIGLGMLVAGVGIVRAGQWTGWRRWTTLATGAFVVVVVLLITSTFTASQIVLGVWMLLFAGVGLTLLRAPR